jgi:hypothetical protein
VVLALGVALADAACGPGGWPEGGWLEALLRCAADVRLLGALGVVAAVARDSSLGPLVALGGALLAIVLARLLLMCWDGSA